MKTAYVCGGTGGHVYPAIALAQQQPREDAIFFVSKHREDRHIVPRYGFSLIEFASPNKNPFRFLWLIFKAIKQLKKSNPKRLVSTGGFFTTPFIVAAWLCRCPVILMEQNALPGRVNRHFQVFASEIHLSFEESLPYFKASKKRVQITGNPVRSRYLTDDRYHAFKEISFGEVPVVLVFGGSQAAQAISTLFLEQPAYFLARPYSYIVLIGNALFSKLDHANNGESPYLIQEGPNYNKLVFMPYFEHMKALYDQSALVVCRAGATSIAELIAYQKKAILIPYPHAKDNHQVFNAEAFLKTHRGKQLSQADLSKDRLLMEIDSLIFLTTKTV